MSTRSTPLERLDVEKKAEPIFLMLSDEQALGDNGISPNTEQGATVVYKLYRRRWLGLGKFILYCEMCDS